MFLVEALLISTEPIKTSRFEVYQNQLTVNEFELYCVSASSFTVCRWRCFGAIKPRAYCRKNKLMSVSTCTYLHL